MTHITYENGNGVTYAVNMRDFIRSQLIADCALDVGSLPSPVELALCSLCERLLSILLEKRLLTEKDVKTIVIGSEPV